MKKSCSVSQCKKKKENRITFNASLLVVHTVVIQITCKYVIFFSRVEIYNTPLLLAQFTDMLQHLVYVVFFFFRVFVWRQSLTVCAQTWQASIHPLNMTM